MASRRAPRSLSVVCLMSSKLFSSFTHDWGAESRREMEKKKMEEEDEEEDGGGRWRRKMAKRKMEDSACTHN